MLLLLQKLKGFPKPEQKYNFSSQPNGQPHYSSLRANGHFKGFDPICKVIYPNVPNQHFIRILTGFKGRRLGTRDPGSQNSINPHIGPTSAKKSSARK